MFSISFFLKGVYFKFFRKHTEREFTEIAVEADKSKAPRRHINFLTPKGYEQPSKQMSG